LVAFDLQSVGVDRHAFDVLHRRHVLFIVLLGLLLLAELSQLEDLQPALVAKDLGAELNHLTIDHVVGRDILDKLFVKWLDIRNHQHIGIDLLPDLHQGESSVLDGGLVGDTVSVPDTPRLLLSFNNEELDVVVCSITQPREKLKLSLSPSISLDC